MEEDKPEDFLLEEARLFIGGKYPYVEVTVAKPASASYIYATQLIEAYLRERLGLEDIRYSQLDCDFIEGMDFYLKFECSLFLTTVQIMVIFLRKLTGVGQQRKYIRIDPFVDYKAELPRRTRRYFITEELQRILQTPIIDRQFERARQLFLLYAFIGLVRVDMQRLGLKHIIRSTDDTEEIHIKRQKADIEAITPLLPIAEQILSLYIKDEKVDDSTFPNLTTRKASLTCMSIGQICRIEKSLTLHMARHTFSIIICLSNGISMETLGKMFGHSNIDTTQIYGKITDHKIQGDMTALTGREHSTFEGYYESIAQ